VSAKKSARLIECDEFTIAVIRRTLQSFYSDNQFPSVESLRLKCLEDPLFPKVGRTVFHQWLVKKCKFKFKKINKKPVYMERPDIIVQRANYLRKILQFRKDGYTIYYSDETWTSPEQTRDRLWLMHLRPDERRQFDDIWNGQVLQDMNGWCGTFQNFSIHTGLNILN